MSQACILHVLHSACMILNVRVKYTCHEDEKLDFMKYNNLQ